MPRGRRFPKYHLMATDGGNGKFCRMTEVKDTLLPVSAPFRLGDLVLLENNETRGITEAEKNEVNNWIRDYDANK